MTPYKTLIEQQSPEVFVCTVPFPDLTPVGDDLVIETDRLLSHCLSSLNATVAELEADLAAALHRATTAAVGKAMDEATIQSQAKTIAKLRAEGVSSAILAEKEGVISYLSGEVVELRERVGSLEEELQAANQVTARVGSASAQAAEASAKLKHAEERIASMSAQLEGLTRRVSEGQKALDKRAQEAQESNQERARLSQAVELADKAKANALAAQAAGYEDRIAGLSSSHAAELAALRKELSQRPDVDAQEIEVQRREVERLRLALDKSVKNEDSLERIARVYREQIAKLEGDQVEQQATILRQRNRLEKMAEWEIEVAVSRYMVAHMAAATIYASDSGSVRILELDVSNLPGLADHQDISREHPICWWMASNGMGCLLAISTNLDAEGKTQLIMPAAEGDGGLPVAVDGVMPPKEEYTEIANAIANISAPAMLEQLVRVEATAHELMALHNPEVTRLVEAKVLRTRAAQKQQAYARKVADRKAKSPRARR